MAGETVITVVGNLTGDPDLQASCVPHTQRNWGYGGWREQTVCTTHTYFGNGVEPNGWPCLPETRAPVE